MVSWHFLSYITRSIFVCELVRRRDDPIEVAAPMRSKTMWIWCSVLEETSEVTLLSWFLSRRISRWVERWFFFFTNRSMREAKWNFYLSILITQCKGKGEEVLPASNFKCSVNCPVWSCRLTASDSIQALCNEKRKKIFSVSSLWSMFYRYFLNHRCNLWKSKTIIRWQIDVKWKCLLPRRDLQIIVRSVQRREEWNSSLLRQILVWRQRWHVR